MKKKELLELLYPFPFANEIFGEKEERKLPKCTYTENYLFLDYEAQQETGTHIPNLIIVSDFVGKEYKFDTNEELCKWLISNIHKDFTCIAHNSKAYDSQFILKYCVENTLTPVTIYNGSKLMLLKIPLINLKIIDSSNFIQGPLANFPKTFGLSELKKGFFPHLFNTKENTNYVGPIPDKKYYCFDQMKPELRKEFLEWHSLKEQENYIFDLNKELIEYCRSDVDILRRGCLKFRGDFLEIANIDPFKYVTIAGVCMAIYRSKFLLKDTIAVLDKEKNETYSKQSIMWIQHFNNKNICHALNSGEKKILDVRVDGFDEKLNTIYQYYECFWHGCTKCFKDRETINNINNETMEDLFERTINRNIRIKNAGYNLVEKWECDWKNSDIYKKMNKNRTEYEVVDLINPRDAFYGGRTNAIKLRVNKTKKAQKNIKIRYIDVCSLYPTVNYYDYYPIGHPDKILQPKIFDKNWFGLIKCKVLPPNNLYHPVLPIKVKMEKSEKLLFPLCYKCASEQIKKCSHSEDERQFIGTWTTDEINKAIEKGYIIKKIYEVWNFKKKSVRLFKKYVNHFMKIKLESSKHNYNSNEEYIKATFDKTGILLEKKKYAIIQAEEL